MQLDYAPAISVCTAGGRLLNYFLWQYHLYVRASKTNTPSLTVSRHGAHIRSIHDTLVLISQSLYVALAEVQDLLLQHSAVLMAGSLLNGEMQQHHSPDEPKTDQEEPQLLGR